MIRALAITVSNRAAAGVYADRSGPVLADLLRAAGCEVDGPVVIPDGATVETALRDAVRAGYDVVVTTGGTGLTPGDETPEMTRLVLDREIPGIAEAIRAAGVAAGVPSAVLSRGVAGVAERDADREPAGLDWRCPRRHGGARRPDRARGRPDPRRRPPAARGEPERQTDSQPRARVRSSRTQSVFRRFRQRPDSGSSRPHAMMVSWHARADG